MDIRSLGNVANSPLPSTQGTSSAPAAQSAPAAAPLDTANPVLQSAAVPNMNQVKDAVKELNKSMQTAAAGIEFTFDPDTDKSIVKVVDNNTRQVLRQIPSEEALELAKAMDKMQGLLIKQEA